MPYTPFYVGVCERLFAYKISLPPCEPPKPRILASGNPTSEEGGTVGDGRSPRYVKFCYALCYAFSLSHGEPCQLPPGVSLVGFPEMHAVSFEGSHGWGDIVNESKVDDRLRHTALYYLIKYIYRR